MQGFTTATQSVNGGAAGNTTASIHAIGEAYTLVLLNGHRMASYTTGSEVNLNQIPLGAVDHVDVLTDGASALYGADAIAGVVNIITKKDTTDGSIDLSLDHPFKAGGQSATASISKGFGDLDKDRYNVFFSATFDHESALQASQRSFSRGGGILNFKDSHGAENVNLTSAYAPAANVYADTTSAGATSPDGSLYYNPSLAANGSCTDRRHREVGHRLQVQLRHHRGRHPVDAPRELPDHGALQPQRQDQPVRGGAGRRHPHRRPLRRAGAGLRPERQPRSRPTSRRSCPRARPPRTKWATSAWSAPAAARTATRRRRSTSSSAPT